MLEIKKLRENTELIKQKVVRKHIDVTIIDSILALDKAKSVIINDIDNLKKSRNDISAEVAAHKTLGNEVDILVENSLKIGFEIDKKEKELLVLQEDLRLLLLTVPNAPDDSVPLGKTPEDNQIVYENEKQVTFNFVAKPHWELAKNLNIIDFELGVKITGAGFPVYKNKGAKLQRALINFFLDKATEAGYLEMMMPHLVNADSGYGTGQLPDKEGQMYFVGIDQLYLIPTAEVPITNIYRDVILDEKDLPIKNCGYTPCFRREAGSYGAHVRGLNRLHQFDKVEIVRVEKPENSYKVLEEMCVYVRSLLDALELPYRQVLLCTGDMSFASAKTYDMEVWSAAQEKWLEVSSISNFETFQSNRMKLRYRGKDKKTVIAHTLNGSALALPRIVAALIENNQQEDGSVLIPKVLQSYTGFIQI